MKDFLLATEALISAATPKSAGGGEVSGAAGLAKDTLMKLTKHLLYATAVLDRSVRKLTTNTHYYLADYTHY